METDKNPLIMYAHPKVLEEVHSFFRHYVLETIIIPPSTPRTKFPNYDDRVCRFCKRGIKETSFKMDSHAIPLALNNKYLVSDDECDECNSLFSKYETCLTDYLGIYRTICGSRGRKNKVPKFKTPGKELTAVNTPFQKIPEAITISDHSGTSFNIDDVTGNTTITYPKHSYVPFYVYKAVLKIALSLIEKKYIPLYEEAFNILATGVNDEHYSPLAKVGLAYTSRQMKTHCMIFKKIEVEEELPTHIFQIYYQDLVFQVFLPLNKEDYKMYTKPVQNLKFCPPIFFQPVSIDEDCNFQVNDFSSTSQVKEYGTITMRFDPNALKGASAMNPLNGQEVTDLMFNPKNIAKIMIVPEGITLNFGNTGDKL